MSRYPNHYEIIERLNATIAALKAEVARWKENAVYWENYFHKQSDGLNEIIRSYKARVEDLEAVVEKVSEKVKEVRETCNVYDHSPYLDDVFDELKAIIGEGEK